METKICSKCKQEQNIYDFHKYKNSKDGYKSICKKCISEFNRNNIEKNRIRRRKWQENHPDYKIRKNNRRRIKYLENKKEVLSRNAKWRHNNKEKIKISQLKWIENNMESVKLKRKEYRYKNKLMLNDLTKNWREKNYEYYLNKKREYNKSDIGLTKKREWYHKTKEKYAHVIAWRSLLHNTLKRLGTKKESKTIDMLGYSALDLKLHIENQFEEGMSWKNWGKWHIDHKIPVSKFEKFENPSVINALSNLKPLWALENLKKYNK